MRVSEKWEKFFCPFFVTYQHQNHPLQRSKKCKELCQWKSPIEDKQDSHQDLALDNQKSTRNSHNNLDCQNSPLNPKQNQKIHKRDKQTIFPVQERGVSKLYKRKGRRKKNLREIDENFSTRTKFSIIFRR